MRSCVRSIALAFTSTAVLTLIAVPAEAGTETSGLFVEFTATRNQERPPATLETKQMCPDFPGTHTFAPAFRVEDSDEVVITDNFVGFEFSLAMTRSGTQPTLEKVARVRVARSGIRPLPGEKLRINFNLLRGDCVRLVFAPETDLVLLSGDVVTVSLFLIKEPPPPLPPPGPAPGTPLASCAIDFDSSCPNAGAQCGATFAGGNGCVSIGVGSCYSSGAFSYELDPGETVSIELGGDLNSLDVFFAARGTGQGTMTFVDADGNQVGTALQTNGNCMGSMPPLQRRNFATPVRTVRVTTTGSPSFIDDFLVNPQ
jgi:hypothetical protein